MAADCQQNVKGSENADACIRSSPTTPFHFPRQNVKPKNYQQIFIFRFRGTTDDNLIRSDLQWVLPHRAKRQQSAEGVKPEQRNITLQFLFPFKQNYWLCRVAGIFSNSILSVWLMSLRNPNPIMNFTIGAVNIAEDGNPDQWVIVKVDGSLPKWHLIFYFHNFPKVTVASLQCLLPKISSFWVYVNTVIADRCGTTQAGWGLLVFFQVDSGVWCVRLRFKSQVTNHRILWSSNLLPRNGRGD